MPVEIIHKNHKLLTEK